MVHGLGDLRNNDNDRRQGGNRNEDEDEEEGGDQQRDPGMCSGALFNGQAVPARKHPRKEHFCDMLRLTACPDFTVCSFTFWLVVVVWLSWLIHMIVGAVRRGRAGLSQHFFLGVVMEEHVLWGARYPFALRKWHLHRLLLPAFHHVGLTHVTVNSICLMIIGFLVER